MTDRDAYAARVWAALEAQPGFNEQLAQAERDLEAGRGVLYEVKNGRLVRVRGRRAAGGTRPRPPEATR